MPEEHDSPEAVRARLLELLEGDDCDWVLSERTKDEGRVVLRWLHNREPTEWEIVEYVISLLKTDLPLRSAPQGNPPGSTGMAWQMTDDSNVFVKLRICERRIGQEYAHIHIHKSVHPK